MNLTSTDLALHAALGIDADLLVAAHVRRVDDAEARDLLGIRNHHGDLAGVVYPRMHPTSQMEVAYRIRRDHPEMEGGKPKDKYLSSVDRAHLFFVPGSDPLLSETSAPAIMIESEKAAL